MLSGVDALSVSVILTDLPPASITLFQQHFMIVLIMMSEVTALQSNYALLSVYLALFRMS